MKTVYFIRHAKSSWADPELGDFDRPLNARGNSDAPLMAKLLAGKIDKVDKLVSSPALRAFTTAVYFAKAFGLQESNIHQEKRIYEATPSVVLEILGAWPGEWNTVLLFGHNPTFTEIANRFSTTTIGNVPTCGIVQIQSPSAHWQNWTQEAKVVDLFFPKIVNW